jgi:hypothetical protein
MVERRKSSVSHETATEQEMRDQEVVRANKELAAYFQGRRTDREARAALKIIKAFVRDRERRDAKSRPPLPGARRPKASKEVAPRKAAEAHRRKPRRRPRATLSRNLPSIAPQLNPELPQEP